MAPRFDMIKFNLVRAIEMFQNLNHDDLNVTAPPSSANYAKENELAEKLDRYIDQLIDEGFFDSCDSRSSNSISGSSDSDEDEIDGEGSDPDADPGSYDSRRSTPRSAGFEYPSETRSDDGGRSYSGSSSDSSGGRHSNSRSRSYSRSRSGSGRGSNSGGSSRSFGDRFKRYIKRILPGKSSRS